MNTISSISANYVAHALNYNGDENWGTHDAATVAAASPEHFSSIAHDVKSAGFNAIYIWTAHCHFRSHDAALRDNVKSICAENGLQITSYAGGLNAQSQADVEELFAFAQQLSAPMFAGGIDPALINDVAQEHGVRRAFENHPEKSADEILARIGNGKYEHCGVSLDTGWQGTIGIEHEPYDRDPMPEAITSLQRVQQWLQP
jgi:hypothetical protein